MFCEESELKVAIAFFFLNFDTVFENSTPENFANIFRTERDGISAIEFETARIHFISDVFVALAFIHPWCRNLINQKPTNRNLPTFSPDFTLNRQIWLFYAEKGIFLKKPCTLLKEQGPGISLSYYECDCQILSIHREKEEFE